MGYLLCFVVQCLVKSIISRFKNTTVLLFLLVPEAKQESRRKNTFFTPIYNLSPEDSS